MSDNPYYEQAMQSPAKDRFHRKVPQMVMEATLDPHEKAISAIGGTHGQNRPGQLIVTNKGVRWYGVFPFKKHDYWALGTRMELIRNLPPHILLGGNYLFQVGLMPRAAKEFVSLYQLMCESMRWEAEHAEPEPVPVVLTNVSVGDELIKLEQLLNSGRLTEVEFETAKAKLLGA